MSLNLIFHFYFNLKNFRIMYLSKKHAFVPFILLCIIGILCLFFGQNPAKITDFPGINDGDTAWMLTATAFVFLMTPGLAFFLWRYGKQQKHNLYHVTKFRLHGCCYNYLGGSRF